jgi:hypothetical protein
MECPFLHVERELVRDQKNPAIRHLQRLFRCNLPVPDITPQSTKVSTSTANIPSFNLAPTVQCSHCGDTRYPMQACMNKFLKCTKCGRGGHLDIVCSFLVVPVTGIPSTSAQPISVSTATSLPSRPFVRSSMMTTSRDAQTQTITAPTLPITSVYHWFGNDNPRMNIPGQLQVPPPWVRNLTGLWIYGFRTVCEHLERTFSMMGSWSMYYHASIQINRGPHNQFQSSAGDLLKYDLQFYPGCLRHGRHLECYNCNQMSHRPKDCPYPYNGLPMPLKRTKLTKQPSEPAEAICTRMILVFNT